MPAHTVRWLTSLAAAAWISVGGYGVWEIIAEDSAEDWEIPYAIFSIALFLGTLLTVAVVWIVSRPAERSTPRTFGLGVSVVAVVSTVVAWALPLWMTLSAVGYALIAAASASPWRRAVAMLSASQVLGMAAMFVGIALEMGPTDEYGDHPAAFGLGILVTAVATVGALHQLDRAFDDAPAARRSGASGETTRALSMSGSGRTP